MRAPSNPILLVIATVALVVAGCASQPKEDETSRAMNKPVCAEDPSNPLHLTTLRKKEEPRDPQLESLLNQGGGPRLQQINREMYQTLRSLDAELRREQQIAACKRGDSDVQSLQAQSMPTLGSGSGGVGSPGNSGGGVNAVGGASAAINGASSAAGSNAGAAADAGAAAVAPSSAALTAARATAANARTSLIRKASVPPTTIGGGGNGAAAQKVSAGSDNDIVARRLRKAAEQETDPAVKAKLWKEYARYEQGLAAT
jgi:hypothetical protein